MFDINGTVIIFIVSFLVFVWIFNRIVLKPVGHVIDKRKSLIEEGHNSGLNARAEADELLAKYQVKLVQVRQQATEILRRNEQLATDERQRLLEQVAMRVQESFITNQLALEKERQACQDFLTKDVGELTEMIIEKLLRCDPGSFGGGKPPPQDAPVPRPSGGPPSRSTHAEREEP